MCTVKKMFFFIFYFFLKDYSPLGPIFYIFFAQIQIYIQDGMCRLEPARTGTMFSDGCWGLSPHITDCNQLQVSIFPQFPSMPLDFALSPHCKFSPLTNTLDNQHGSRAGQCENNSLYA